MSCFAPSLIHFSLRHSALRPLSLYFFLRTGQTTAPSQRDSCLAVLPNSLLSQVTSPNTAVEVSSTEVTTEILPSRKDSIGSTYNSGEHGNRVWLKDQILGMMASPLFSQETQMMCGSLIQKGRGFILSEHRDSHNFLDPRADRAVRGDRVARTK